MAVREARMSRSAPARHPPASIRAACCGPNNITTGRTAFDSLMSPDFVSILVVARWGSVGLMVIVLLMMTYILCLRAVLLMRERRYRNLSARWTPILLEGGASSPRPLPSVAPGERFLLLILWNTLRERNEKDGGICHWMGRVAAVTQIDRLARRLLRRRSVRKQLLGLVTLGQLRDRLEWPGLCQIAQSGHPLLSLAATQAIARIDPAQAAGTVVSLIVTHLNWPAAKVAGILEDIGPERVSEPLARCLLQAPESHRPALIPFLAVCNYSTALRRPSSASRRRMISGCATSRAPSTIATPETS